MGDSMNFGLVGVSFLRVPCFWWFQEESKRKTTILEGAKKSKTLVAFDLVPQVLDAFCTSVRTRRRAWCALDVSMILH